MLSNIVAGIVIIIVLLAWLWDAYFRKRTTKHPANATALPTAIATITQPLASNNIAQQSNTKKHRTNKTHKTNKTSKNNKNVKTSKTSKTSKDRNHHDHCENEKDNTANLYAFMVISIDNEPVGRIVIQLYDNIVPKTCENFATLCVNKTYKGAPFHRIISDFMIQGGDHTSGDGRGGKSIYGSKFEDENFILTHDSPYMVSMANSGPNTNGSQFFITTQPAPSLNNKHVVFGKVVDGIELIDELNDTPTDRNDRPVKNIIISDCGIIA